MMCHSCHWIDYQVGLKKYICHKKNVVRKHDGNEKCDEYLYWRDYHPEDYNEEEVDE